MPKAEKTGCGPVLKQQISLQTTPSPQDQSSEKEKPDFRKVIRELTPEDWIRHEILLYRRRPKLAIQGLGGFVAKFQYPLGIDDSQAGLRGLRLAGVSAERRARRNQN